MFDEDYRDDGEDLAYNDEDQAWEDIEEHNDAVDDEDYDACDDWDGLDPTDDDDDCEYSIDCRIDYSIFDGKDNW